MSTPYYATPHLPVGGGGRISRGIFRGIIIGMGFMYSEIQLAMSGQKYQLGPPLHYRKPTLECWIPIRFHTINYSYMMGGQANGERGPPLA